MRVTREDYAMLLGRQAVSKKGNRCLSKHHHPSKSEAQYCDWLLARKQNREIKDYKYICSVELHVEGKLWKRWAIDFSVQELDGTISYHESKGWNRSDDSFRLKLRAFMLEYPERKIYVNKNLMTFTPKGLVVVRKKKKVERYLELEGSK